jgi:hypothetical protein
MIAGLQMGAFMRRDRCQCWLIGCAHREDLSSTPEIAAARSSMSLVLSVKARVVVLLKADLPAM